MQLRQTTLQEHDDIETPLEHRERERERVREGGGGKEERKKRKRRRNRRRRKGRKYLRAPGYGERSVK